MDELELLARIKRLRVAGQLLTVALIIALVFIVKLSQALYRSSEGLVIISHTQRQGLHNVTLIYRDSVRDLTAAEYNKLINDHILTVQ